MTFQYHSIVQIVDKNTAQSRAMQVYRNWVAGLFITGIAVVTSCTREGGSGAQAKDSSSRATVRSSAGWIDYRLVSHDGSEVPKTIDSTNGCARRLESGSLRISTVRWQQNDSLAITCPGNVAPRAVMESQEGPLRHSMDTLIFEDADTKRRETFVVNRALLDGDSGQSAFALVGFGQHSGARAFIAFVPGVATGLALYDAKQTCSQLF